jgi:hypothetical protein
MMPIGGEPPIRRGEDRSGGGEPPLAVCVACGDEKKMSRGGLLPESGEVGLRHVGRMSVFDRKSKIDFRASDRPHFPESGKPSKATDPPSAHDGTPTNDPNLP